MIKVLIVCSFNSGRISPFINDQVESLKTFPVEFSYFLIRKKGLSGYLFCYFKFRKTLRKEKPDIVHGHYGLSGLIAGFQRKVPAIVSFHGSDINNSKLRYFSRMADRLSSESIFVSRELALKINSSKATIIPCGVNPEVFYSIDKKLARSKLGYKESDKIILFSSHFDNPVKNYPLAKKAIALLELKELVVLEIKNLTRQEVNLVLNASDCLLLTSHSEGSPQVIKEALACNIPIVSTNVGDVSIQLKDVEGCYVCSADPKEISEKLIAAMNYGRTDSRKSISHLESTKIASSIMELYLKVSKK